MIDITVVRDAGDNPGEDIINPLILTEAVAVSRGRNEIDRNSKVTIVTQESKYRSGIKTGHIVQVLDALQGSVWLGKITSVDIAVEGPVTSATLGIEKV